MTNAKLTQDELQAIKERAEKATEGPWESDCYGVSVAPYGNDSDLAHVFDEHDAEFIANARQDIPKLVAEVERLREALSELKRLCGNVPSLVEIKFTAGEALE